MMTPAGGQQNTPMGVRVFVCSAYCNRCIVRVSRKLWPTHMHTGRFVDEFARPITCELCFWYHYITPQGALRGLRHGAAESEAAGWSDVQRSGRTRSPLHGRRGRAQRHRTINVRTASSAGVRYRDGAPVGREATVRPRASGGDETTTVCKRAERDVE